jgi:hydrogenase expression/formation protein HypE
MKEKEIRLAHGGGGQLTNELIHQVILPALGGGQDPKRLSDSATVAWPDQPAGGGKVVFTTDSFVVWPLEFPGADIGKLAVCGTLNDLAVSGAHPAALSMALVLEEGLSIELLARVLASAGKEALQAGVRILTGDTKVVERRGEPGLVINTTGLGYPMPRAKLGFDRLEEGDRVLLSGPLGQHGLAVMIRRKGLSIASTLQSDCANLQPLAAELVSKLGPAVKWMRDPTRGGLAATLAELSDATGRFIEISQQAMPVDPAALSAAEFLGLDLLSVANEGKLVAVVKAEASAQAVKILRQFPIARQAADIGQIGPVGELPLVEMLTRAGGRRIVQMPYGEELPRIC